ncbi:MAG: hypothetical protein ABRQ37_21695 [Candidatus Eremiobacterota bacterium]
MVSEERTKTEEKKIETEQQVKSEQKKMEKEPVKRYEEIKSEQVRVEQKQVKPGQNIKTEQQVRTEEVIKKPVNQSKDVSSLEAKISDLTESGKKTEVRQKEHINHSNDKKIESMIKTGEESVKTSPKESGIKNNDGHKKEVIEQGEIKAVFDKLKKEIISDRPDALSNSKTDRPSGQLDALSKVAIKTLKENSGWKGIKTSDLLQSIVTTDLFSSSKDTNIFKKFEGIKDSPLTGSVTPVSHRDKIAPSKDLTDKKGPKDISREDKPFVQNNLFQFLKEKAFTIISAIQLLIGNSDKADNQVIREAGDRLNLQDNVSLYDKSVFAAKEDIKERKKKIMPGDMEMEQLAALEKAKNVTVVPNEIHSDSKLQLLRQCQMCQTKVGVDMVLCPACAKLRKNLYTDLKLMYKTDGNKNYFTEPVGNKNYIPGHISGGKHDHLELSLDAINVFSGGELEEVASMRRGQVFPKMKDVLALSKENSMYRNKEMAF